MKYKLLVPAITFLLFSTIIGHPIGSSQKADPKVIMTGTVYDFNHAVIVLAGVVARDVDGKDYEGVTNGEGHYKFELPVGMYKIEADAPGFCPKRVDWFRVFKAPKNKMTMDFVLDVSDGERPCKQETMIKKQPKEIPQNRLWNIAD